MQYNDNERRGYGAALWTLSLVVLLLLLAGLLLAVFLVKEAAAQAPAVTEPRGATLVIPGGASVVDGNINVLPSAVDAIVRTQTPEYLQKVTASLLPKPQDFTVGRIEGGPGPSTTPIYIAGRVVEAAAKVQFRIDGGAYLDATTLTVTRPGYPKAWTLTIPPAYHDGRLHKVYARALRASGTVIGPLDNAKSTAPWTFTIGAGPLPPVTAKCGTIDAYAPLTGVLLGSLAPGATHVEPRVGTLNLNLVAATDGRWSRVVTGLAPGTYKVTAQGLRRSGPNRDGPWEVVCTFDNSGAFTVTVPGNGGTP